MSSVIKSNLFFKLRNILLLVMASLSLVFAPLGCASRKGLVSSTPKSEIIEASPLLIQRVKTEPFIKKVLHRSSANTKSFFHGDGVDWFFPNSNDMLPLGIGIGVFTSEEKAAVAAKEKYKYASGIFKNDRQDFADYFLYMVSSNDPMRDSRIQTKDVVRPHGSVVFRRRNVVISYPWKGDTKSAVSFAQKIDNIILHNDTICPKGSSVPIPNVDLSTPDKVPLRGTAKIKYQTSNNVKVKVLLATSNESTKQWNSQGSMVYSAMDLGKQQVELRFATQDNVIFTKTITVNVVPKQEYIDSLNQRQWGVYGSFYLRKDEKAAFLSIPFYKREIIEMDTGTVHDLKGGKLADAKKRDLEEMKSVVQEKWLPEPQFLQPGFDVWKAVNHEVYTARFETKGLHVLYLGKPGKRLWLYIEQPDGAAALPILNDIIQPAVLKTGTGKIALQSFTSHRYSSANSEGPWQSVNILVIKIEFASDPTIDSFGSNLPHQK